MPRHVEKLLKKIFLWLLQNYLFTFLPSGGCVALIALSYIWKPLVTIRIPLVYVLCIYLLGIFLLFVIVHILGLVPYVTQKPVDGIFWQYRKKFRQWRRTVEIIRAFCPQNHCKNELLIRATSPFPGDVTEVRCERCGWNTTFPKCTPRELKDKARRIIEGRIRAGETI